MESYVLAHYPDRVAEVIDCLQSVHLPHIDENGDVEGRERVHAAMLAYAQDDQDRLIEIAVLAESDWRDVLMGVPGFAHEGWEDRVAAFLSPATSTSRD